MSVITFGTDGWRARIAREFTFDNFGVVVQAIADLVHARAMADRGVIVGYDSRFLSEQFAAEAAGILAANNIHPLLTDRDAPVPAIAFAIIKRQTAGAIVITASHNPPEYSGVKYIPEYASPALPDITQAIEANVARIEAGEVAVKGLGTGSADIETFDPKPEYFEQLRQVIDVEAIRRAALKVCVDPLHATARGYLGEFLRSAGCEVHELHAQRDPLFGGSMPDPSAENLQQLGELVRAESAHVGVATDGDADRFGAVDEHGEYLTANQLISIVFAHSIRRRFSEGGVGRTVATTHLLDAIAAKHGFAVYERPVGFKFMGQLLRETDTVLAGEESGGMSIKGHIPEKDGILADLLLIEAIAQTGRSARELLNDLHAEHGVFVTRRLDLRVREERKHAVVEHVRENPPDQVGGVAPAKLIDVDGLKVVFEGGSWMLIRPSGTEPLIRCYVEANDEARLQTLADYAEGLVK